MAIPMYKEGPLPMLLEEFSSKHGSQCTLINKDKLLKNIENNHFVNKEFMTLIKKELEIED